MALQVFDIAQSVKAGGLAGLGSVLLVMAAAHFGVVLTPDVAAGIVTTVVSVVSYLVPDSKKQMIENLASSLNMDVKELAALVPQIQAVYPGDKGQPSAQAWKDKGRAAP